MVYIIQNVLRNHIRAPTCFVGTSKTILLNIIQTNKSKLVNKTLNFCSGLSDFYCTVNSHKKQTRLCRSFTDFDSDNFIQDLKKVDFETNCEDVNEADVNFSR